MDPRMQELDEGADKSVLQEIIKLMGKLNADDLQGHVNVMGAKAPEDEGQVDLQSESLPGEEPSVIPESEDDKDGLEEALESAKQESDEDEEDELRSRGRIF